MSVHTTVVLIEDEVFLRNSMEAHLKRHGFNVDSFENGETFLNRVDELPASIYLIDQRLPGVSGLEVLKEIRKRNITTPIFMVTAYGNSESVIKAMESGADDFLTKPIGMDELIARVRRALRRQKELISSSAATEIELEVRKEARILLKGQKCVALTGKELEVFEQLFEHRGEVVTRESLYEKTGLSSRILDVHMFGLRKKLSELGEQVQTIRGVGYRLL